MNPPKGPLPNFCQHWNWPILLVWGHAVLDHFNIDRNRGNLLLQQRGETVKLTDIIAAGRTLPWIVSFFKVPKATVGAGAFAHFGGRPVVVIDMSRIHLSDLPLLFSPKGMRTAPTVGWNLPFWSHGLSNIHITSDYLAQLSPIIQGGPATAAYISETLRKTECDWTHMCAGCFSFTPRENLKRTLFCSHLLCNTCLTCHHYSHKREWSADMTFDFESGDEEMLNFFN